MRILERSGLDPLIAELRGEGLDVFGPVERDGALTHARVRSANDLPAGRSDRQEAGRHRLVDRDDRAVFAWAVGAESWKRWFLPPERRLWSARRGAGGALVVETDPDDAPPRALLGVRPCDLAAIRVHDRVLLDGPYRDETYARRRASTWIVVAHCSEPAGTCFCDSAGTGPRAVGGFDLGMTELLDRDGHRFLIDAGSERGGRVLARLPTSAPTPEDLDLAERLHRRAVSRIRRTLDVHGLSGKLREVSEHPHWGDVAERCLACGNCTAVCPTCFCHTVEDRTDLAGHRAERVRRWDSCFTAEFTYIHGGSVRAGRASRYRQWLTHKLDAWTEQFGTSGCVGCGRCITWCPVGIDLTREVRALVGPAQAPDPASASREDGP